LSCRHDDNPQAAFDHAYQALLHGNLLQAQDEARRESERFHASSSEWGWKFRTLEAKAMLHRGLYEEALKLLGSAPMPSAHPELVIPILTNVGLADVSTHRFSEAEHSLNEAAKLCETFAASSCGYVLQARGLLSSERSESQSAEKLFQASLSFARAHADAFLEADSLVNLGYESLAQGHFDEAIDRSEAAYQIAKTIGAQVLELISQGNIGWAHYKLGDSEKALELFLGAEKLAKRLDELYEQGIWLTDAGYVYMGRREFTLAEKSLLQALEVEERANKKEDIYNALRALARLSLQTNDLTKASDYAQRAAEIARQDKNHLGELYPLLLQGQIAAHRGDFAWSENTFRQVERDKICPVFLKWEAEHSLARLYEDEKRPDLADREYRAALATFEAARADVRHEDSQISFLTNASRIYDDYVRFLVARGKTDDALHWADYNRARALAEGLGLLAKVVPSGPPLISAREIARQANGTILFYWMGEKQSYLWAISPQRTALFTLPPGPEIDATVERYRNSLGGPQDVLQSADNDGRSLYDTLIAPAQTFLGKDAKVFIIPDGSLNNLNFETLLVPEPKLHFWIEDVTIANASSLRMLAASRPGKERGDRSLLLIGNSVAPNPKYPELPKAASQMEGVAKHFPGAQRRIFTRQQATPAAYLASSPEQFSYIHFVAHGTASRLSPLDSAIVLSKDGADNDSFKLYARDIIRRPLSADLVVISACYGAGERWYSGEGLVGLSWAFLRAGAHNVIAALWDVSDVATEQLMNRFYDGLDNGMNPDAALRAAKLSLLRDSAFHNPFYWAPFQLYGRGQPAAAPPYTMRSAAARAHRMP
jgi:CHAT domain-containing protein